MMKFALSLSSHHGGKTSFNRIPSDSSLANFSKGEDDQEEDSSTDDSSVPDDDSFACDDDALDEDNDAILVEDLCEQEEDMEVQEGDEQLVSNRAGILRNASFDEDAGAAADKRRRSSHKNEAPRMPTRRPSRTGNSAAFDEECGSLQATASLAAKDIGVPPCEQKEKALALSVSSHAPSRQALLPKRSLGPKSRSFSNRQARSTTTASSQIHRTTSSPLSTIPASPAKQESSGSASSSGRKGSKLALKRWASADGHDYPMSLARRVPPASLSASSSHRRPCRSTRRSSLSNNNSNNARSTSTPRSGMQAPLSSASCHVSTPCRRGLLARSHSFTPRDRRKKAQTSSCNGVERHASDPVHCRRPLRGEVEWVQPSSREGEDETFVAYAQLTFAAPAC